ncbi:UDP-GlcNAc--UDP-phosphate GlcNAc-1-phosphate transferase [Salinimicrobium gaetbulicola]|uniref:UDP-GlcNAc--UDP-phosphate GlcNAc-1-phosphate transferase n=1 Tax=Salinimicrobium gaetbulicola TaxID=999702 RepID=A0ABW3IF15_9FLAO
MLTYFLSIILFIILALSYSKVAKLCNILDFPNERSSHNFPIIRGGGILFFFAAILFYILSDFQHTYFILGLSIISILSFIDDLISLKAIQRLPFQFLGIYLMFYSFSLDSIPLYMLFVLAIVAVGFINIYNFMDGINGITGMYSLAVLQGFWILNEKLVQVIDKDLIILTGISLIIFGYFNFRTKAKFFAGDIGSISLAGIILFIGIKFLVVTNSPLILLLTAVYGIDAGLTILRRALKTDNIFEAHRQHLYQHLVDKARISHLKVAGGYAMVQLIINLIVLFSSSASLKNQYLIFFLLLGTLTLIYFALLFWSRKQEQPQFSYEKK